MSQSIIPFLSKLGDELQDQGYRVTYIPQNKRGILEHTKIEFDDQSFVLKHVSSTPESSFEKLLDKYNIRSPRSVVFPQMVYDYEYTNVDHQPFVTGPDRPEYEPYFNLLHRALDTFDRLFSNGDGGIPIQRQGGEILRRALQRVADAHGVQSVWTGFSPLDNHVGLYSDESVNWETFDPSYEVKIDEEQRDSAREYVSQVRERQPVIGGTSGRTSFDLIKTTIPTFGQVQRVLSSETDTWWRISRWSKGNAREIGKYLKGRIATKLYLDRKQSRQIINNKKYVFFPLQYVRESRVTVRSSPFYDLVSVIEYLSRSLPYDYELVVKDHPRQLGALPIDSMRAISRYAHALDPSLNAHEVVRNADAIVTLNNTVGYEALIHGKPVIVLGSAFYDGAEYVHKPDSLYALPDVLEEAIDSGGLSEGKVLTFAHRIIEGSHRGRWKDSSEENVSVLVDSILDFCDKHNKSTI